MHFIDIKALMSGGRQCGVVVFAAGVVHGFTMPESISVGIAMCAAGFAIIFICSLKPRRKK